MRNRKFPCCGLMKNNYTPSREQNEEIRSCLPFLEDALKRVYSRRYALTSTSSHMFLVR